jgi:tetratricopeptide (TPR) repeat protein
VINPEFVPTNPGIVIRFAYIPAVFAGIFFIDTYRFLKNKQLKNFYIVFLVLLASIWTVESYSFQTFFKDGNTHYQQLVKHYPDDGSILLPLALQKAETGDFREALNLVNHALAVNERDQWIDISETAGLLKANLLIISRDELEGKKIALKILEETKKNDIKFFAWLVLSKYHEKKQEYTNALAMLKKAESIGETPDLFYRMSILYTKMKRYKKALFYLEKAKEMNPELPKYFELNQFILNKQSP